MDDTRYTEKSWAGYKLLCCAFPKCEFDTMYLEQFDVHYYQKHERENAPKQRRALALLYDASNNVITEIEEKES